MKRSLECRPRWIAIALACATAWFSASVRAAEPGLPVYEKKATFAETMLAARAALLTQRQAAVEQTSDAKPFATGLVAGDGPAHRVSLSVKGCRWLRLVATLEQGGGNCHIWGEPVLLAADGTKTRLSDLKPAWINVGWGQLHNDRNWQNNPLKIEKRQFEHGLWVHSNSDVGYALDGKYERFEAWVGMDAARPIGAARFQVLFDGLDLPETLWKAIAGDFPQQSNWFVEDTGRRHLEWFADDKSVKWEQTAIQRALGQLTATGPKLRAQLDSLRGQRIAANDARWLSLYERTRRAIEGESLLANIWIVDLHAKLADQLAELLTTESAPQGPAWQAWRKRVDVIAQQLPTGTPLDCSSWPASIEALGQVLPNRFGEAKQLQAELEARREAWSSVLSKAAEGDAAAVDQLAGIAREMAAFRHRLLTSPTGMSAFLDQWKAVDLASEWQTEHRTLQNDLGRRAHFERVKHETLRAESLIAEDDRDPLDIVLRRTAALWSDLTARHPSEKLASLGRQLDELRAAGKAIDPALAEARYVLFADACRLRRQIALANPLLDFDEILFIKRHRALYDHMCDQYYGMAARPGGGLYVLSGALGGKPHLRDVLADATVADGRLKGQKLSGGPTTPPAWHFDGMGNLNGGEHQGGCFLSPELSFDGRTILFAYVECQGDTRHRHHVDPAQGHSYEGRCYHVFKVDVDGNHLEQLTDGTWNDFDPCWLPNGRIAFISERRGGYLRCGRVCPNYTLFDMAADGSDINCLSYHETNEWHPSVTNDGKIVWTRWDYVDRHGCTAHMPWITTVDGRDPRALHGNFAPRSTRPDMELDVRAIPGSPKFVGVAAPHHGQAYGTLIQIDPQVPDDDGMGPVRRITPEVGFPESQGGGDVYGTPWPLSEDYFLCVYDADQRLEGGRRSASGRGDYGIYLVDSFGNRELIYRDAEIASLSPIPCRPRPMPPVLAEVAHRGSQSNPATRAAAAPPEGAMAVINVYDSIKPWPEGTKIKALRVLQVFPMSVPSGAPPHETGMRIATAGDSVVPVRHVLGTVPVEADGSAYFTAPAQRELFFQALDEKGLAVQSMRSATHVQAGERLVCAGCHEPKHRVAETASPLALALRREPSRPVPDVEGSNPFSYPRLVQPVLDRHCAECHAKNADTAPNLAREPIERRWFASYNSLSKYGFTDYGDAYRTTPGRFGARASKLYEILDKGHHDVKLSPDEMYRLTLWLDCATMFYGVYEKEQGEAQLRGEIARPTLE